MEWVAYLKAAPQEFPCLCLRRGSVHRRPFRRKLCPSFVAPISIYLSNALTCPFTPKIFEQPPAHHLANLSFIIYDEVFGYAPDDLGNPILPLKVPIRHFYLTSGEANQHSPIGGSCHCPAKIVKEC